MSTAIEEREELELQAPEAEPPALEAPPPVAPALGRDRLAAVDTLRGVAVLGILWMNIPVFGLVGAAVSHPNVAGGDTGIDLVTWFVSYVIFEGKMRGIFSMLFGAGVILLTSRAEARGGAASIADIYYRRNLWLIVFGALHAFFLWFGDILFYYGTIGLLLYPLRKASATALVITGIVILALTVPRTYLDDRIRRLAMEAETAVQEGRQPTEEQRNALRRWEGRRRWANPTEAQIQEEVEKHHSGYWEMFAYRARTVLDGQGINFYSINFFDIAGMMILGMGLMKFGVFSAERSLRFYMIMTILAYAVGLSLSCYMAVRLIGENWDPNREDLVAQYTYHLSRLLITLGHVGLVMIVYKKGYVHWLTRRLAAVGQMALTNYLMHSLICVLIFEGFGLGLFNDLWRHQLIYVVAGIWTFQLIVSPIWLRYFRFGPMEWLWRALTYWQLPPMRVQPAT